MPENYSISPNKEIFFSDNGLRLYFASAPKPFPEPKDTLTDDEKCSVDIWNWKDKLLQPNQLKKLEKEKKISFTAVYFPKTGLMTQLGDTLIRNIIINKKNEGKRALGIDDKPYWKNQSWESSHKKDIYLINQKTGEKQQILKAKQSSVFLSPDEKYIVWYESVDSSWKAYSIKEKEIVCLTKNMNVNFYNEKHDMPFLPGSYGTGGWTKNDNYIFINDRFDIWKIDPSGKKKAENLTKGYGRENNIRFRIVKLDKEALFVDEDNVLLSAFNEITKQSGFFRINFNSKENPQLLIFEDYNFNTPQKAENSDKIIWNKSTFIEYPELWVSNLNFGDAKKISTTNPQQEKYLWGTNELLEWTSFNGNQLCGILYKPENFDSTKKYPMITYFYERSSDMFNRHLVPKPSRSVINFPLYTSNGYIIFVPDIIYKTGLPGKSAYNAIHSGVMKLCERNYIDKENIGLQGQSWGGYQVAYLVTQTNFYKAAMAGAPVSNMTSAYGGIRWGSGMSRMFQYEESQSRIGGTLWDKTNLYIENSPVFYADRIETPLLIMHNDNDGAVPWYQGIELFVALRRLNKPAWMLTYNGAPHNLSRRADCEDLSIRMLQFFNHYLKNAPIPVWMEKGIPAIEKGKNKGYELVK
ncbi:MAG: S9 family peptidase [Bacteroidales bacterium]|nr:S9 family peptidase [Bacteroidales bacterium]